MMMKSSNDLWICASITLLIIPILFTAGCTSSSSDEEKDSVRITLALDKVERNVTDSPVSWNAYIWVDNIEPLDFEISWASITVDVEDDEFDQIMGYKGVYEFDDDRVNRDNLGVYREDLSGDTRTIDIMDMIVLFKIPETFEGGLVRIHYKARSCGSVYLPDDFP
jgi:hypothetical protein